MGLKVPKAWYILQNLKPVAVTEGEYHDWKVNNTQIIEKTHIEGWWVVTRFLGIPKRKVNLYECYINKDDVEKVKYVRTLGDAKNLHYKTVAAIRDKKADELK